MSERQRPVDPGFRAERVEGVDNPHHHAGMTSHQRRQAEADQSARDFYEDYQQGQYQVAPGVLGWLKSLFGG